ncbi:MAG: phosphoribosylformylglycinamidine cyclo-ligase [Candidatus Aminicenantales bacterium]
MSYKKAGVDIDKADAFVKKLRPLVEKAGRPEVLGRIGGFSGLFKPRFQKHRDPVLVSATDGVGTKILVAEMLGKYDTIGIDLVAMCANDVVVTGAEPLFFLDYIATGKLDPEKMLQVMRGIAAGCREAGCALIGGETAELPGMMAANRFDLAGFCVGAVGRRRLIDGRTCRSGDVVVGLASSGLHSNGFSLVRKLFSPGEIRSGLGRVLLRPTKIYARTVLRLVGSVRVKALAHITGGGFIDNIPRVLPRGLEARIAKGSWPVPMIFRTIQRHGHIEEGEMLRTFNMGVGMVVILSPRSVRKALEHLSGWGQRAWVIGRLAEGERGVVLE